MELRKLLLTFISMLREKLIIFHNIASPSPYKIKRGEKNKSKR